MTATWENEASLIAESWKDDHVEALSADDRAWSLAKHRLARNAHLLYSAVIELEKFAFESDIDIGFSVRCINLLKLGATWRASLGVVNVGVGRAEESIKDLEVLALVDVAWESVRALHDAAGDLAAEAKDVD